MVQQVQVLEKVALAERKPLTGRFAAALSRGRGLVVRAAMTGRKDGNRTPGEAVKQRGIWHDGSMVYLFHAL